MTLEEMQSCTSYLLGYAYSGIKIIVNENKSSYEKLEKLSELEIFLRNKIEKLYYTIHDPETTE